MGHTSFVYVDMDSGTILNGPVYRVPSEVFAYEDEYTDTEAIALAETFGDEV